MKKLPSFLLRQVLEQLDLKSSYRDIERITGVSRSSISRVMMAVVNYDSEPSKLLKLDDNALVNAIYPVAPNKQAEPDWQLIHKKLSRRSVTMVMLYEQYVKDADGKTFTYTSFCRRYNQWKKENGIRAVGGNVDRVPGERMEIDFVGDDIEWVESNGEVHKSRLFVATLPFSCIIFTEAFADEKQESWIQGIVDALEYFGGSPQTLVMDNAKPLVTAIRYQQGEVQAAIGSLCAYYRMQPWACKPRTPKQKNRVEAAANDVERWIIAEMSLNHPVVATSLDELNKQIRERLDKINDKPFRSRGSSGSRRSRYEAEERHCLSPLPALSYESGQWRKLVVDKSHCIRIASDGGHRYSTPASYIGKKVDVRLTSARVDIYDPDTNLLIGSHARSRCATGNKTHILEEHLTDQEKHYRLSKEEWIERMERSAIPQALASEFVYYISNNKGNFPSGRLCSAVCHLTKIFSSAIVRKAIATALEDENVNYKYIRKMCELFDYSQRTNGELDFEQRSVAPKIIDHENLRRNYE